MPKSARCPTHLAARFAPEMRAWAENAMMTDTTGRLAQIVEVCPGLLIAAFVFDLLPGSHGAETAREIRASIQAGVRLGLILRRAGSRWRDACRDWTGDGGAAFRSILEVGPEIAEETMAKQRLLWRRASAGVLPADLFCPPPMEFMAEDLPTSPADGRRWFRIVKSDAAMLGAPIPGYESPRWISAFVSANAIALANAAPRTWRALIAWMLERAASQEWRPARRGSVRRLVAHYCRRPRKRRQLDVVFPTPPVGTWTVEGTTVRPLRTARELLAEGEALRHCVGSLAPRARAARAYFYSASIDGHRLTIEIRDFRPGLRLGMVRGFANREPTVEEIRRLQPWLALFPEPLDACFEDGHFLPYEVPENRTTLMILAYEDDDYERLRQIALDGNAHIAWPTAPGVCWCNAYHEGWTERAMIRLVVANHVPADLNPHVILCRRKGEPTEQESAIRVLTMALHETCERPGGLNEWIPLIERSRRPHEPREEGLIVQYTPEVLVDRTTVSRCCVLFPTGPVGEFWDPRFDAAVSAGPESEQGVAFPFRPREPDTAALLVLAAAPAPPLRSTHLGKLDLLAWPSRGV